MSIQDQMKATLSKAGLPHKDIDVYGSQIVVTTLSRGAADKWVSLIAKFAKVRGVTESIDYAKVNKNTCLLPSRIKVWRVFAAI